MSLLLIREVLQELLAELTVGARDAGVDFVDDDALRGLAQEVVSVPIALDVIETDDDERVILEEVFARGEIPLDLGGTGCRDALRADVELVE